MLTNKVWVKNTNLEILLAGKTINYLNKLSIDHYHDLEKKFFEAAMESHIANAIISIYTIVINAWRSLKTVKLSKEISKVDSTNGVRLQACTLAITSQQMLLVSIT